jgi:hypothetical protein
MKAIHALHRILIMFLTLGVADAYQQPILTRRPGETLQNFASRILPKGMKLAHPALEGDFGSSKNNVVILFQEDHYREFSGWVLIPGGSGYKKFSLPEVRLPVSTQVEAVFYDNADRDSDKELLILCKHISGVGRSPSNVTPFWTTYVYDWNGNDYSYLEDVTDKLDAVGRTRTAQGVRRLLRRLGY